MTQQWYSWAFVLEKWKFTFMRKPVHTIVHKRFTLKKSRTGNKQNVATQARETVVHAYHGAVLHSREGQTKDTAAGADLRGIMLNGKQQPIRKAHTECESVYIISSKRQNCRGREQVSGCQG